jgi:hypothetical protein
MSMPDHVTVHSLRNFVLSKTPLYRSLVDAFWAQANLHNIRADYAVFYCLWYTNYFRASKPINDFGGGTATDTASGVNLAVMKFKELGDWLQLPANEYEGMKHVEQEFLRFVGVRPDDKAPPASPKPLPAKPLPSEPVPVPKEPEPAKPAPIKPAPSKGGFWAFIRTLAGILAALNAIMFVLKLWLPAPVVVALQAVIKFVTELADAHPAQAFAVGVSSLVATHAVMLKTKVPAKWQRPDKGSI